MSAVGTIHVENVTAHSNTGLHYVVIIMLKILCFVIFMLWFCCCVIFVVSYIKLLPFPHCL